MDHQSDQNVLRPQPRRPGTFSLTPISTNTSSSNPSPDTPSEPVTPESRDPRSNNNVSIGGKAPVNDRSSSSDQGSKSATKPQKTRSILNLTSSTLFGIYSPTGYDADRDEPLTPWGTGAQTPARSTSVDAQSVKYTPLASTETFKEKAAIGRERRKERRKSIHQHRTYAGRRSAGAQYAALLGRTTLLFLFGVAYGEVVAHLHDTRNLAPVRVDRINRSSWQYLGFWGMAGVVLGCLLPWSDSLGRKTYDEQAETDDHPFTDEKESQDEIDAAWSDPAHARTSLGAEWNPIVRSVGAFIGIAFAIVSVFSCRYSLISGLLTPPPAQATLAIDLASVIDASSRQPCNLVPHRSHSYGFPDLAIVRHARRCCITGHQPRVDTCSGNSTAERTCIIFPITLGYVRRFQGSGRKQQHIWSGSRALARSHIL